MGIKNVFAVVVFVLLPSLTWAQSAADEKKSETPAPKTAQATVELEWEPVNGASGYEVEFKPKSGDATKVISTIDAKLSQQLPPGTYTVRIRSKEQASGYFGVWSPGSEIEAVAHLIQPLLPLDKAVISLPKELRSRVVFKWTPTPEAKIYILKIWPESDPTKAKEFRSLTTELALRLPTGQVFHWQVSFESKTMITYESPPQTNSFTLLGRQLLTPSLDERSLFAPVRKFTWSKSPNSVSYHIKVSRRYLDETRWTILSEVKQSPQPSIDLPKAKPGVFRVEIIAQAPNWLDSEPGTREFTIKPTAAEIAQALAAFHP